MKARTVVLTFVTLVVGATMCFAANPNLGTWKLNEAKSKLSPDLPKNLTVVYEAAGDNMKATIDGVDAKGKPTHNEWTGKFDGKDYPINGDPGHTMVSLKRYGWLNVRIDSKSFSSSCSAPARFARLAAARWTSTWRCASRSMPDRR